MKNVIHWLPRILGIGFVLFLSVFALDVFDNGLSWNAVLGFLIHLIPSFVLLALLFVAWKYDLAGAIIFLSAALLYVYLVGLDRHWSWYAGISGPAALVGVLFFLSWLQKRRVNLTKNETGE
jgi:hypothetical protein